MKLLASVLLASASVMAIQRREDDVDHNMVHAEIDNDTENITGMEHGDEHESEEPDPPAIEEIEGLVETTTPYEDHNVTVVHTTQSTIDHRTEYTIDIRTTAHTSRAPETTAPPDIDEPEPTAPPHIDECGEPSCGCNAEEMARWEHEMAEWKRDQELWKIEFNKWLHEYGSDSEIHHWEHDIDHDDDHHDDHHDDHDEDANADIGWDIIKLLTEARFINSNVLTQNFSVAGQICPLLNLLSDTGLELGDFNLQEECDFQAAELSGLAEIFLKLSSSSSEDWSHQFCDYLANMVSEELTRYGSGVLVPNEFNDTCSCLVNILVQGPLEVDATAISLCGANALNLVTTFTGSP